MTTTPVCRLRIIAMRRPRSGRCGHPLLPGPGRRDVRRLDVRASPKATHITCAPAR